MGTARGTIREDLQERFGITEQHLFSDFPGFALSHAHDRSYRDYNADDYFSLGLTSHQQGEYEKAREFYDQALTLDSQNARAYGNRGSIKAVLGDQQGAIADFSRVLELDPQYAAKAYDSRGLAKAALGDYQDAIADFDQALELDPQYVAAYSDRGFIKAALDDHQGAIADYDQALKLDPQYARAYNNREKARRALSADEDRPSTDNSPWDD